MLTRLLALTLCLLPIRLQDPAPSPEPAPEPTREQVEAAVASLRKAFAEGEAGERVRAIEGAAELGDESVITWIAKGLDDKQDSVRAAAVAALRYQAHPGALEALHGALRKAPRSPDEDKRVAALILAIGQHASVDSLPYLEGASLDAAREHSTRARIQALGRVRDVRAVEELISLMNKAGQGARGGAQRFERDFRLSLWALTGTDEGAARESWMRWWNKHKHGLEVLPEVAGEPRQLAGPWRRMWLHPREAGKAAEGRKGRRGRDGEPDADGEGRDGR